MNRLINTISQMFLVLVLLFRSPQVIHLRDLVRRPAVVMVSRPPEAGGVWPPLLPQADVSLVPSEFPPLDAHAAKRIYVPVKAA